MKRFLALLLALVMVFALAACSSSSSDAEETETEEATEATETTETEAETETTEAAEDGETVIQGLEDGVLTIAMECAYAPYNWTQYDDSNGAVPISGSDGEYANGYDVMIAKLICEYYGWDLEVIRTDWDSLVPGVQSGIYDAVIAGQSMTEERSEQVDFAGPYYYASIVCVTLADSEYASATGLTDLAGGTCTAQIATIWYDSMLPQIPDAQIQTAAETAPAMLMALETGSVDFICTDMPTAMGAVAAYDDMVILDFSDSDDNFEADEGEINIGVSVMKGNTTLKDAIDAVLSTMTVDDFNELMDEAIAIQPLSED
ncbi:MAG: transporter substrate-binding domain-containing protein [Oscillospiraceae bacterium]|nr:transporter substrate-binding domain-containing protein [Oscillospiraceae bacterium]